MAAAMEKTSTPGIYRRGGRYVVVYRDDTGRQRKESARTLEEARRLKAKRITQVDEDDLRPRTRQTFAEYAPKWIETYQGKGRGFRERTRDDYRRDLERYVIPFLGNRRITAIRREHIREFVAWLTDDDAQAERHRRENEARKRAGLAAIGGGKPLADGSVHRLVTVASACFQSMVMDDLRRDNPVRGVVQPQRDQLADPDENGESEQSVKALTRAELAVFLEIVNPRWRVFFELLASTGLRVSEALALDVAHLRLDGDRPVVKVRRAVHTRGKDVWFDRPKSQRSNRDVPLSPALVSALRRHVAGLPPAHPEWGRLVFGTTRGREGAPGVPVRDGNIRRDVLRPAAEEACVSWAGFRRAFVSFFFSSRRPHTRSDRAWSSDVCSSDLGVPPVLV